MSADHRDADVIVVGYGPVGATAANFLGAEGLEVIVLERDPSPYPRARAISTDEEVLRCWQHAGLAEGLKEDMLGDRPIDFVDGDGRSFMSFTLKPRGNGHPTQMFIYQPALEGNIRAGVERYSNVEVLLEREAGQVRHDPWGAEVDVTDLRDESIRTLRARYVLACDGGASPVRTQLGVGFEGKTYENPWVVVDTKVKEPWPEVDRLRFHCYPERPAVDCPTPLGHHRWEFPILPGENQDEVSSEAYLWKLLSRYDITGENVEILRRAVYVHHVRFAERWRSGNVFLLGDAAHCMPPWIGQGMGSGVRDAHNLCWKIAAVVRGEAEASILESYETERKPHVRKVTSSAVFFGRVITEKRRELAAIRDLIFSTSMRMPVLGRYLRDGEWFPEQSCASGFVDRGSRARHKIVGRKVHQPKVTPDGATSPVLLDDVLGRGWSIISRTPREAGAWDGRAHVVVIGRDVRAEETLLDDFLSDVDAVVLRPDKVIFAAAKAGEQLPPPPAELHGAGAPVAAVRASVGERALAAAAERFDDRGLERAFGNPLALAGIFKELARAFVPRVANGFSGELQYDLRRSSGRVSSWTVRVDGVRAAARHGKADDPDLTVRIGLADFLRMAAGQLDQVDLLKSHRLDASGDGLIAARLGPMFGRPAVVDRYVKPRTVDPPSSRVTDQMEAMSR
ncbi:MAG: bifunctional 3-(3-hydroxy-phenyl)propionate/3-hydroxycinnamic acid hydroxylase [Solirubrobacterales bacterium]